MDKKTRICPMCSSQNLKWLLGGRTGDQYKCVDCEYQGPAIAGDAKFIRTFKRKLNEAEK